MAGIGRLLTAMVTPFDDDGEINYKKARKLATALINSGSDGLVIGGTTGESPSDRKSTRLNSSHKPISYAVFCLKKKTQTPPPPPPPLQHLYPR